MIKLTQHQKIALDKLSDEWQSSYDLQVSRNTLEALVSKGLAKSKHKAGAMAFPRVGIEYKKAKTDE